MAGRCTWCHSEREQLDSVQLLGRDGGSEMAAVCDAECGAEVAGFVEFAQARIAPFLVGLLGIPAIGGVIAVVREDIDGGALGYLIMAAGMGLVIIRYPFVTPQTIDLLGMKRSLVLARGLGAALIAAGVALYFLVG